ncbi:MAG: hypothetical protein VB092_00885 [Oscillospiraceae bacterium]|nr:hypothetical protein [Oscillospiraceae bacterium]
MKKFSKWGAAIVAAVFVAVFVIAFFGISTKYGDIETVIVSSQKNITYGNDFDTVVDYVLKSTDDSYVPTAEELTAAKAIVEKRLTAFLIPECEVSCDYEQGLLIVRMPYSARSSYSATAFSQTLTTVGSFAAYKGSEADESMLIFTDAQIVSAASAAEQVLNGLSTNYKINVDLNKEGKAALKEATQALVDAAAQTSEKQTISYWLDGEKIATASVSAVNTSGSFTITSYNFSSSDVSNYTIQLASGSLPFTMSCSAIQSEQAAGGSNAAAVLAIALVASVLLCCAYLIVRYKLCGVATFIGLIGTVGGMLFVITGMFNSQNGIPVLVSTVLAFVFVLFICMEANVRFYNALSDKLTTTTVGKAASLAFRQTIVGTLVIFLGIALSGTVLLLFSRSATVGMGILSPIFRALSVKTSNYYEFAYVGKLLLSGALIGMLCSVLGGRYILYSFEQLKAAKKPVLFGGTER